MTEIVGERAKYTMKGVMIVLDGVADEPCAVLGHATPLQAAKTPHLDALSRKSSIGYCHPVKEGVIPDSASATVSLLGYDPQLAPRGPLEALGAGITLTRGDLAVRTSFATIDDLQQKNVLDSRAGRTLTTKESQSLAKHIREGIKLPFQFEFRPTLHNKGLLVFRGGFSDNITNADAMYNKNKVYLGDGSGPLPRFSFSQALDEEDDSKLAADLVNTFVRKSHTLLDSAPLNATRASKGLFSANCLLCRGIGSTIPRFKKLKGSWMALGYTPLEKGIAKATKMTVYNVAYPKMKSIDVYENLYAGLHKALKASGKMLRRYAKKHDYFYIHLREPSIAGKDNKPLDKVRMIELIDKKLFSVIERLANRNNVKVIIASTHTTSSRRKAATADPVPVLYYDPNAPQDNEQRFTEEQGMKGKKIQSRTLLEKTLFAK